MRSKAEAMAQPMAGDEYAKQRGSIADFKLVRAIKGENIVHLHRHSIPGRTTDRVESLTVSRFRRWAANAEFLGGAE